jgi:hypothetical protein
MMVTGRMPFAALSPLDAWMKKVNNELTPARNLMPSLSERTDGVIRRCMDPDPDKRPPSCGDFVDELSGQSTRKLPPLSKEIVAQELWYLLYKDQDGVMHMVKGSLMAIRRSLKEGLLGDAANVRACRTKTGTFEPLRNIGEFRDLVPGASNTTPIRTSGTPTPVQVPPAPADSGVKGPPAEPAGVATTTPTGIPHIRLQASGSRALDWLKMVLWVLLAVGSGVITAIFLHHN